MKTTTKSTMALIISTQLMTGCAGSSFKFDDARKVEIGMNEHQLTDIMGDPNDVTSIDGSEVWVWYSVNLFTGGTKNISYILEKGRVVKVPSIPKSFD